MNLKIKKQQSVHESRDYYCSRARHRTPSIYPAHMPGGLNRITAEDPNKQQNTRRSHGSPVLTGSAVVFTKLSTSQSPEHEGAST